ncbi:hypothetical protein LPJ73_002942 [Coemansia sp. RSA 2703]|nr:hypothetical protein LPJ73_002942 [Coemansia sp. RSA 2703]
MIESLSGTRETSQLVHASRQTLGSLQTCVKCLTNSSVLQTADTETLKAVALALNAMATQIQKTPPMKPIILKKPNESEEVVASALKTASALAEQLRIFTRVSQQSWAATRSQLAHTPPVPSPLAAGSTPLHRRWASEDIECEVAEQTPRLLGDTPLPLHVRNRSDSRLQIGLATPPRPKHVRFQTRSPAIEPTPIIDQAHLTDLALAVSVFEKAIAALSSAAGEPQPQNIRALATAFVQLSRLASSTGMVHHFDRPTLALFKATTHAVKQMMPRKA